MIDYIAEISSNHNNDIVRIKELIHASKDANCTGIKFQLFQIDQLFSPEILSKRKTLKKRKSWELSEKIIPEIAEYAHKLNLSFGCTPFYLDAVDILEPFVDYYKIASYELLWHDLFKKCGDTGKPLVFSVGMATMAEVKAAVESIFNTKCNHITILHCNSSYPTPVEDVNLSAIITLKKMIQEIEKPENTNIVVGYSDHTVLPAVLYRAVNRYNVNFIEFHIDLDGKGEEYSTGHCWLPEQIAEVINNINLGIEADGQGIIKPTKSELSECDWRADPIDGLRPLKKIRENFRG